MEETAKKYPDNIAVDEIGKLCTFEDLYKKSRAAASAILKMKIKK